MNKLPHASANLSNPFCKLFAIVVTVAVLGLALMFSVIVIAAILVVGTIAFGYLWWKMRALRKQMRNYHPRGVVMGGAVADGEVIEGEVIRTQFTKQ